MSVETLEYAGMMRRLIRAHGRRCAEADPEDLAELLALHAAVDEAVGVAIRGQRDRGTSWDAISRGLGVTRQAAWKRFRGAQAS